jgi:type III secretion protein Q
MTQDAPVPASLALERLTRAQAHALNRIARNLDGIPFSWVGKSWRLTVKPVIAVSPLKATDGEWWVALTWSGLPFDLVISQETVQAWIAAKFPDLDLPALPEPLAAAAIESAFESVVELLGDLPGHEACGRIRLEDAYLGHAVGRELPQVFSVHLVSEGLLLKAQAATNWQGLDLLSELASSITLERTPMATDGLPMTLFAQIGYTWLGLDDILRLQPSDTILLDCRWMNEDGELLIGDGDWSFRVRHEGPCLRVTEHYMERPSAMPAQTATHDSRAELGSIEKLPLKVTFDLGDLSMTLGEIQALQVGESIALARPLSSAVHLRVNAALIGTGELVEIDGELGVTVTSLFQRRPIKPRRSSRNGRRDGPEEIQEVTV